MKEIISHLMVQQVTSMMARLLRLMPRLPGSSAELWLGQISTENLKFVPMQILLQMHVRQENLVQKVLAFAVQSICSSLRTESLLSER